MVAVDRAVLRFAVFEGFLDCALPFKSAISEAVNLARSFGTEDSARFVNGVLAWVVRRLIPEERKEGGADGQGEDPNQGRIAHKFQHGISDRHMHLFFQRGP